MKNRKDISSLSESQLIELARKDQKFFGVLYDQNFKRIFSFVYKRLGGDEDTAGDLTQMTFMKAMANLSKYEDRGHPFSSWLYRIAHNEVMMHFRQSAKDVSVPVDENRIKDVANEANITSYMSMDEQEMIIEILNELPEEHGDLIELRFFQQMSFKEIADIYNITEANAKMRIYRILERINKDWKEKK